MVTKNWHDISVWIRLHGKRATEYNTVSAHELEPDIKADLTFFFFHAGSYLFIFFFHFIARHQTNQNKKSNIQV